MRYRDNPLIEQKYNCARWKKVRKLKQMESNGFCERCLEEGRFNPGKIVHHKEPITDKNYFDDNIMYGLENLMFVCDECHKELHENPSDLYFDKDGMLCQRK